MSLHHLWHFLKCFKSYICGLFLLFFSLSLHTFVVLFHFPISCFFKSRNFYRQVFKFCGLGRRDVQAPFLSSQFFLILLIKIPTWSLTDLFHSKDRLETGFQSVGYSFPNFASLRGTLSCFERIFRKQPLCITGHRVRLSSTSHYCVKKRTVCFSLFSMKNINIKFKLTLILYLSRTGNWIF